MLQVHLRLVVSSALGKIGKIAVRAGNIRTMSSLVIDKGFVGGNWVSARSQKTFEVTNPATEQVIATVADMALEDAQAAIDAAYETFYSKEWQQLTAKERSQLLKVS